VPAATGRVARGSDGAGLARRLYRRSPFRRLIKVDLAHRGLRPSDVFVASYPRSGSSWLRFLLLEMLRGDASFSAISRDVPYVGGQERAAALVPADGRVIKTHEPYLARYQRAIHLVRDPRDVAISYFSFMQRIEKIVIGPGDDPAASFDHFIGALLAGRVDAHGTWQSHLLSWLAADERGDCDVLRLRYEDLRADPALGVARIGSWLGIDVDQDRAASIVERSSLERMRAAEKAELLQPGTFGAHARRSGISLIQGGGVERWRSDMTADQQARFACFAEGLALMGYPPAE